MRGRKSRTPSLLDEHAVERTFVSPIPKTTAPLAYRALFPVSSLISRDPISNTSVNVSRTFILVREVSVSVSAGAGAGDDVDVYGAKPRRPLQIVRKPNLFHVRT